MEQRGGIHQLMLLLWIGYADYDCAVSSGMTVKRQTGQSRLSYNTISRRPPVYAKSLSQLTRCIMH